MTLGTEEAQFELASGSRRQPRGPRNGSARSRGKPDDACIEQIGAPFRSADHGEHGVCGYIGQKKQQAQGVAQLSPAEAPGILWVGPGPDIGLNEVGAGRLSGKAGEQIKHRGRHVQGGVPELPEWPSFEQVASCLCQRAEVPTERNHYRHPGRAFKPDQAARILRRGGKRLFDQHVTTTLE